MKILKHTLYHVFWIIAFPFYAVYKIVEDWYYDEWLFFGIAAAVVVAVVLAFVYHDRDLQKWKEFRAVHQCYVNDRRPGSIVPITTYISNGNGGSTPIVTYIQEPDKEGWLCNDGKTYWRTAGE